MAKILLVCDKVTTTSWELAQALKSQQHQVIFLTSHGELAEDTSGIDFMAFFKSWSALEGTRLLPHLISINPQIVHFVLESEKVTAAHLAIWGFTKAFRSIVFTLSLLNMESGFQEKAWGPYWLRRLPGGSRHWLRLLVEHSDIVTCPSIDSLAWLRGVDIKSVRQGRAVLPPVLSFQENKTISSDEDTDLDQLLNNEAFLLRPFSEKYFDPQAFFFQELLQSLQHYKVVLLGSQDHWTLRERKQFQTWLQMEGVGTRWFLTGHRSIEENYHLIQKATAVWLSDLDLSPVELTEYFLKAIDTTSTLILDSHQELLHAPLWKNGQNCWIKESSAHDFFSEKALKLIYELDRYSLERKDLVDAPLNELNRLYNKALSQKAIL